MLTAINYTYWEINSCLLPFLTVEIIEYFCWCAYLLSRFCSLCNRCIIWIGCGIKIVSITQIEYPKRLHFKNTLVHSFLLFCWETSSYCVIAIKFQDIIKFHDGTKLLSRCIRTDLDLVKLRVELGGRVI